MSELKAFRIIQGDTGGYGAPSSKCDTDGNRLEEWCDICEVYDKSEADKVIDELEESHKKEVEQLLIEIVKLKTDYKEACDRLQTANLIKDEQKVKADKFLSCLKYLVMSDLIKDCPPKKVAAEIVNEYDNGLR